MHHLILIAEDDPIQRRLVRRMIEADLPVEIIEASDGAEAFQRLKQETSPPIALALIDLGMPVMNGMDLLRALNQHAIAVRTVVLTGSERVEDAVEAMQLGALDFIPKPAERERLITSVRNALALVDLEHEVSRLQRERGTVFSFDALVATCPGLTPVAALGRKAANSDIAVLITGESGVGKEVFARAIHQESKRRDKPLVAVNCGALPENLVESTLFGHEKGAFTGALAKSMGKCREADGGVLFLDEIGDLKLETQVKLLRMLQEGEIEPVGSSKTVKVDVRVISATNQPLEKLVREGSFREDLYYRLQGFPLPIPPLRERVDDIIPLAEQLLGHLAAVEQRGAVRLSLQAKTWLRAHPWPGNVRELQHLLHRTLLLADGDMLDAEDFARWSSRITPDTTAMQSHGPQLQLLDAAGIPKTLDVLETEIIERILAHFDAHIGKTASALGIGQSTLYKRMRHD